MNMPDTTTMNPAPPPAAPASANPVAVPQPSKWKYQFQQYGAATEVTLIIFAGLSLYLFFRNGNYDLSGANRVFAGVATVLLGLVLLIGPLSRYFTIFDGYVQYRKELGVMALWLALAHALTSLFFLPGRYSLQSLFTASLLTTLFGLVAMVILIGLFLISREKIKEAIGTKRWWFMQYWGVRTAFLLIALHVGFLKVPSWISWYQKGGGTTLAHPEWPSAGLLIGWFIAFVIIIRLAELGGKKFGILTWYFCIAALLAVYVMTFWWGGQLAA